MRQYDSSSSEDFLASDVFCVLLVSLPLASDSRVFIAGRGVSNIVGRRPK